MKMVKKTFESREWCLYCVDEGEYLGEDFYHSGFYGHGICERCGREDDLATCLWEVEEE